MFLRILNTAQPNSPLQNISDDILMNKDVFTAGSGQREHPRIVLEVDGGRGLQLCRQLYGCLLEFTQIKS